MYHPESTNSYGSSSDPDLSPKLGTCLSDCLLDISGWVLTDISNDNAHLAPQNPSATNNPAISAEETPLSNCSDENNVEVRNLWRLSLSLPALHVLGNRTRSTFNLEPEPNHSSVFPWPPFCLSHYHLWSELFQQPPNYSPCLTYPSVAYLQYQSQRIPAKSDHATALLKT